MPAALPIIAATAVVATGASIYEGEKANKAAKQANQIQQQQADLSAMRQKSAAIRDARKAYANSQAAAENQGVSGSSSSEGGLGSILSQVNSNVSFLDQYNILSDQATNALGRAATARTHAQTFNSIAGLAEEAYGNAPAIGAQWAQLSASTKKVFSGG